MENSIKALLVVVLSLLGLNALADQVQTDQSKSLKDRSEFEMGSGNREIG